MRIGFIVNDIDTEQTVFTTTWLAMKLHNQGHKTCYAGVGDLGTIRTVIWGRDFEELRRRHSRVQRPISMRSRVKMPSLRRSWLRKLMSFCYAMIRQANRRGEGGPRTPR